MPLTRISPKRQITIPAEIFKELDLELGDYLESRAEDNKITLTPQKLIPKEQAWFWTKEWQRKEKEAESDIETGKLSGPFKSATALLKALKSKQ